MVISVPVAQLGTGGAGVRGLVSSSHLEHNSPLPQQCDVGTDSQQDCLERRVGVQEAFSEGGLGTSRSLGGLCNQLTGAVKRKLDG